jgi:hypothetical protein
MLKCIFDNEFDGFVDEFNSWNKTDYDNSVIADIINKLIGLKDYQLFKAIHDQISRTNGIEVLPDVIIDKEIFSLFVKDLNTRNNIKLTFDEVVTTLFFLLSSCDFQLQNIFVLMLASQNKGGNTNEV